MTYSWRALAAYTMQALWVLPALALPPEQVFERAAPGVWALRLLGPDNRPQDIGSAVGVAAGKAVTLCSQLPSGGRLVLQRDRTSLPATLEFTDKARDLCQFDVPVLKAPEAASTAPRMGQRVYAIGYERGAELTIAEGIVSRLREPGSDRERIQTSVPTSGWLLGAGLYDDEARLLGITTTSPRDAAGVVVAGPARWLTEISARGSAATVAAPSGPASVLPQPGATWNYAYAYRGLGPARLNFLVRAVDGQCARRLLCRRSRAARAVARRGALGRRLFSRDLDSRVYAAEPVLEAVRRFLLRSPKSHLRILVQDESRVRMEGSRMIDLLQLLPSHAAVRTPPAQPGHAARLGEDVAVIDERIYFRLLTRGDDDRHAPVESRRDATVLAQRFTDLWDQSEPSVEFRHFRL